MVPNAVGVAIGSGGVYAAAGLGVLHHLESKKLIPQFLGGASAGALIASLYYLEGNSSSAKAKLLKNLAKFEDLKLRPFSKPIPGSKIKALINDLLEGRDWKDGKVHHLCLGAAFKDIQKPIMLTQKSGLSLCDAVVASISLKMIEPIVKLEGKTLVHGGDPQYIKGVRDLGAKFIIEVSPNISSGLIGAVAKAGNELGSLLILKGDYFSRTGQKDQLADLKISPDLSLIPFISPLKFSRKNIIYMINQGEELSKEVI